MKFVVYSELVIRFQKFLSLAKVPTMTFRLCVITIFAIAMFSLTAPGLTKAERIPVFPGAEGFGSDTRAMYARGANPQICIVTDLTDDNETLRNSTRNGIAVKTGSFRECFNWPIDNKLIVFEVSGMIAASVARALKYKYDNLTIAGQTAPNPGITLKGYKLAFNNCNDVLVQHIRVRVGDEIAVPGGLDCSYRDNINAGSWGASSNIVIDHCSMSWAVDENAGLGEKESSKITYSNCIFGEGLSNSCHSKGPHSKGLLLSEGGPYSLIKNLFISNKARNPQVNEVPGGLEMVNNLIVNPGHLPTTFICAADHVIKLTYEGNISKSGQNSTNHSSEEIPIFYGPYSSYASGTQIFLMDNWANDVHGTQRPCRPAKNDPSDWSCIYKNPKDLNIEKYKVTERPIDSNTIKVIDLDNLEDHIIANVGARPADRDLVDSRLIAEIDNGRARLKDSVADAGGYPFLKKNTTTLTIPQNPHSDDDSDGYTNLEEWLHLKAAIVEGKKVSENRLRIADPRNLRLKKR
jgi:hypothetical protein